MWILLDPWFLSACSSAKLLTWNAKQMSARQKVVLFNVKKIQVWELMGVRNVAWCGL